MSTTTDEVDMTDAAKGPSAVKADKNPAGGLSAKGRKKFGVKKGVVSYSSASRADKGRWVSWAMRFTGTPKPVKDANGKPTRYALMFKAWGEPVPGSVDAVKAVHAKAVKRSQELKNADKADYSPELQTFVETHLVGCSDCERAFKNDDALWTHVENVHLDDETTPTTTKEADMADDTSKMPAFLAGKKASGGKAAGAMKIVKKGDQHCIVAGAKEHSCHPDKPAAIKAMFKMKGDKAALTGFLGDAAAAENVHECYEVECDRAFIDLERMREHAEVVHIQGRMLFEDVAEATQTFSDIEELVRDAVRDKYNVEGDYRATPPVPSVYAWVRDMATDWVVYQMNTRSKPNQESLFKSSYSITDGVVTLGAPTEVVRKTVYEPVKQAAAETTGA